MTNTGLVSHNKFKYLTVMDSNNKIELAIQRIDEANSADPSVESIGGQEVAKELLYAQRMSNRLHEFYPDAPEELQLAARAQHICRWEIPRSDYSMDRDGYLTWRNNLKKFHAEKAGRILSDVGYENSMIERVQSLIQKKRLKRDPLSQALEDVVCLVFLEYYFESFAEKYEEDKLLDILKKTWAKMSDQGHEAALKLPLSSTSLSLVSKAVKA